MKKTLLPFLKTILKTLARLTIRKYNPGIVGVTGNVGKTSAKEAIGTVLGMERNVRASSKNFNNEFGLPLSIICDSEETEGVFSWIKIIFRALFRLMFRDGNYPDVIVLEYGIDRTGDMKYLLEIARPQIGVFTAMGEVPVHIEFFSGIDAIVREKSKLVGSVPTTGFAILNADDERVMSSKEIARANIVTFGFSEKADLRITNFSNFIGEDGEGGVSFKLSYGGTHIPVRVRGSLGRASAYAAASATLVGLVFGMNLVHIAEGFQKLIPPKGRQRVIQGIKHSVIIDDTYNASPAAMEEALRTIGSVKAKRKIAVLGDMLELGKYTLEAHQKTGKMAPECVDMLFTVGTRGKILAEAAARAGLSEKKIFSFLNIHEAAMQIQQKIQRDDLILVKGSQGVRMERIVKEIMAQPLKAGELLVRQDKTWLRRPGLYD